MQVHGNFTKEDSGHNDMEMRSILTYLPETLQPNIRKIIMYTHRVFYKHRLEDLATKGLPGGGADGQGGVIQAHHRDKGRMGKDDFKEILAPNAADVKMSEAIACLAASQVSDF